MSELDDRETEIREAAKGCRSYGDLLRKFPRWTIESVRQADVKFELGLAPEHLALGAHRPGVAVPKPTGKGSKKGGSGE